MNPRFRILAVILILGIGFGGLDGLIGQEKRKGPPPWAPAHGYRAKARHVYFPEYNIYFDLQRGVYIYLSGGTWAIAASLPKTFAEANLKASLQIELDLDTDTPQKLNAEHKVKYKKEKEGKGAAKSEKKDAKKRREN